MLMCKKLVYQHVIPISAQQNMDSTNSHPNFFSFNQNLSYSHTRRSQLI